MNRLARYLGYAAVLGLVIRKERHDQPPAGAGALEAPPKPEQLASGHQPRPVPPLLNSPPAERGFVPVLKRTFTEFMNDDCMSMGAAIAYYTVFSLPPLLLLIISIAGMVFGREAVQKNIAEQIQGLIGSGAATQVDTIVKSAASNHSSGVIGVVFGALVLVFGATGCFIALQDALNKAWHVKPDPNASGIKAFVFKRLLSLGMIVAVAFLLLVSLAMSAALSAFSGWFSQLLSANIPGAVLHIAGEVVSFLVITVMFAAILKFLPDAKILWRDVWIGAAITAVLFTIGKTLIGLYLGKSGATSAYGAAGSLMLIVLWLYYASLIFLMGAEFTKVWAASRGREIQPEEGAVRVVTEERHER